MSDDTKESDSYTRPTGDRMLACLGARGCTVGQRIVLAVIAYHDGAGGARPAVERISKLTGISRTSVFTALGALERMGWIRRRQWRGANRYTVAYGEPFPVPETVPLTRMVSKGRKPSRQSGLKQYRQPGPEPERTGKVKPCVLDPPSHIPGNENTYGSALAPTARAASAVLPLPVPLTVPAKGDRSPSAPASDEPDKATSKAPSPGRQTVPAEIAGTVSAIDPERLEREAAYARLKAMDRTERLAIADATRAKASKARAY